MLIPKERLFYIDFDKFIYPCSVQFFTISYYVLIIFSSRVHVILVLSSQYC